MSCEDRVPLGSQIKVSSGGKTELCVIPARHCGIGAMATGLAVPCPDEPISPDNRAVVMKESHFGVHNLADSSQQFPQMQPSLWRVVGMYQVENILEI